MNKDTAIKQGINLPTGKGLKSYIDPKLQIREIKPKEKQIRKLFAEIIGDQYKIKGNIEKLGGMNNNNYRVNTDTKDFVFRLPGKGSNESVNRDSEFFNSKISREIGIDCNTIYFDNKSGLKITEYIENAETLNIITAKKENNMELMSYALNILHNSGKKFYKDFKPFIEMKKYKNTIIREEKDLLKNYRKLDSTINFLKGEIEKLKIDYVPCHLDAWPENFVKGTDKIYLIDWEYSGNYDRLWDVVSIGLECEYSKDEEKLFYNKYFGRKPRKVEIRKMNILRILMDVYWSMWSLAKVSCGEKDLYDYSIGRYNRAISNLNKLQQ